MQARAAWAPATVRLFVPSLAQRSLIHLSMNMWSDNEAAALHKNVRRAPGQSGSCKHTGTRADFTAASLQRPFQNFTSTTRRQHGPRARPACGSAPMPLTPLTTPRTSKARPRRRRRTPPATRPRTSGSSSKPGREGTTHIRTHRHASPAPGQACKPCKPPAAAANGLPTCHLVVPPSAGSGARGAPPARTTSNYDQFIGTREVGGVGRRTSGAIVLGIAIGGRQPQRKGHQMCKSTQNPRGAGPGRANRAFPGSVATRPRCDLLSCRHPAGLVPPFQLPARPPRPSPGAGRAHLLQAAERPVQSPSDCARSAPSHHSAPAQTAGRPPLPRRAL